MLLWIDAVALQREEEKATQVIRQAARNGQTQGCHNIAVAISNSRKMCRRLQTIKFRLDSVEINLQQQRCNYVLFIPLAIMLRLFGKEPHRRRSIYFTRFVIPTGGECTRPPRALAGEVDKLCTMYSSGISSEKCLFGPSHGRFKPHHLNFWQNTGIHCL